MDQTAAEVLAEAREYLSRSVPRDVAGDLTRTRQDAITRRANSSQVSPEEAQVTIAQICATLESLNAAIQAVVTSNMQTMATLSRLVAALTPPENE